MSTPDSQAASLAQSLPTLARLGPPAGRWLGRFAVWLAGLALLYVLSSGPALKLNKRGVISPQMMEAIYLPLSFVTDIPGCAWLLEQYLSLWEAPQ